MSLARTLDVLQINIKDNLCNKKNFGEIGHKKEK
jgi:hypothetical protein